MMLPRRHLLLGLFAVGLMQTAVLGWMVYDRIRLLTHGREVVLPILPVDPRDLFRGEYVRLGYDISRLKTSLLVGPAPKPNAAFYVTLERGEGGAWLPVQISAAQPAEAAENRIVLKGRTRYARAFSGAETAFVRYGIESYFVPEGKGRQLETLARDKKLAAILAVDRAGNAAIKGLMIDGAPVYSEPLL